jgi:hypothetical protein
MKIINGIEFYTLNEQIEMYADKIGLEIPVKIKNKREQICKSTTKKIMLIHYRFGVIASNERIEELTGVRIRTINRIKNNVKL